MAETLEVSFVGKGAEALSDQIRKVGGSSELAAKGAKALKDALDKQNSSVPKSAAELTALAKAVKTFGDAEDKAALKAIQAEAAIKSLGDAAEDSAAKTTAATAATTAAGAAASEAGGGFEALQSPMVAAVGAGVLLSPVLITLGVGLGGLAAAAAGVAKPIEDAAQKTGGLQANMSALSPALQPVAQGLIGLQKNYQNFTNALQPQVIGVFNSGIKLAGDLLTDIQPVAVATGTAFQGFLGQLDKEFQGGEFQSFFQFMARTAGPDMQLVGNLLIDLTADLPPLLEALQPLAEVVLSDADSFLKLVGGMEQALQWVQKTTGVFGDLGAAANEIVGAMIPFLPLLQLLGTNSKSSGTAITGLASSTANLVTSTQGAWLSTSQLRDGFIEASAKALTAASSISTLTSAYSQLLSLSTNLETAQVGIEGQLKQLATDAKAAGATFTGVNTQSQTLRSTFEGMVPGVQNVVSGMKQAGAGASQLAGVISADLKPAVDAGALSNNAFRQQIYDMATEAGYHGANSIAALKKWIDSNADSAQNAAKSVDNWSAALANLPSSKGITVTMTGNGYYTITESGANLGSAKNPTNSVQISQGAANSPHAAGGFIATGTGPTADDVPIRVSRGEYVVKASSVSKYGTSTLDAINAGKFASGGIVGGNLTPGYIAGMYSAFQGAAESSMVSSMRGAIGSASGKFAGGGLVRGGSGGGFGFGGFGGFLGGGGFFGGAGLLGQLLAALQSLTGAVTGAAGSAGTGVAGSAGGFGLTRSDLGLPATIPTDSGSAATPAADTTSAPAATTSAAPAAAAKPAAKAGPNSAQKAVAATVSKLMSGYIYHNQMSQAGQANAILDYVGTTKYDHPLHEIAFLNTQLAAAQKKKNKTLISATEKLLGTYGVHVFKPGGKAKGNPAQTAAVNSLTSLMKADISGNNMGAAGQVNSLLTHFGDKKYSSELSTINHYDSLLAQYKKSKNTSAIAATETLLKQYGVKKFANGGWITEPVTGIGASGQMYQFGEAGRPELVVPQNRSGGGSAAAEQSNAMLGRLSAQMEQLIGVAAAIPARTGQHVAAGVAGPTANATFRARFPQMAR